MALHDIARMAILQYFINASKIFDIWFQFYTQFEECPELLSRLRRRTLSATRFSMTSALVERQHVKLSTGALVKEKNVKVTDEKNSSEDVPARDIYNRLYIIEHVYRFCNHLHIYRFV